MELAGVKGMRLVAIVLCGLIGIGLSGPAHAEFLAASRHFSLHSEYNIDDPGTWTDPATVQEALVIGRLMDTIYDRYLSLGFSPARLDRDENGRMTVNLYKLKSVNHGGNYAFGMSSSWDNIARETAYINLNITQYRSSAGRFSHTIAHELFHALQYATLAGANIMDASVQAVGGVAKLGNDWLIEGTADAAAFLAADGIGGFAPVPGRYGKTFDLNHSGPRRYSGPLHMDTLSSFPGFAISASRFESYRLQTYYTSSFWRFLSMESNGLPAFKILFSGSPGKQPSPLAVLEWVHTNIKRLPFKSGSHMRFPGGLPQAYAEFISEFADLPFITKYGKFTSTGDLYDDGIWQKVVFGRQGRDECEVIHLSPARAQVSTSVWIDRFASTCFRVSLSGKSPASPPPAFEINVAAATPGTENYVCQAVALGSNGVTQRAGKVKGLVSGPGACKLHSNVLYAPRSNMSHQNVILTNVHAAGGSGSLAGTRQVEVRVDFVLGAAAASGYMSPSQQSASAAPPPPAPGAPATAPAGQSTGKNISINSIQAGAAGAQARHAPRGKLKECETWEPACPVIDIAISQYDERFDKLTAMGTSLGAGALLVLDGGPRQVDLAGTYGNPQAMAAMARELAGSEFAEVSMRLRAPEGRITAGMKWDNALIDAGVGIMAAADNTYMHSRGPHPVPGSCLSDPPPSGKVEITEVGEGWIKGTFSADLFENYVQQPWKDPCAARPATGQVSGSFTAPYHDVTQPPVDPELAAYQVWAGLPAVTWSLTDYDALVRQAVVAQRDILRDWEAERRPGELSGSGVGVGGPSAPACYTPCVPGMAGCPTLAEDEAEKLAEDYLTQLPDIMRDNMRKVLANTPPDGRSMMLAIHFDIKGCMDER